MAMFKLQLKKIGYWRTGNKYEKQMTTKRVQDVSRFCCSFRSFFFIFFERQEMRSESRRNTKGKREWQRENPCRKCSEIRVHEEETRAYKQNKVHQQGRSFRRSGAVRVGEAFSLGGKSKGGRGKKGNERERRKEGREIVRRGAVGVMVMIMQGFISALN